MIKELSEKLATLYGIDAKWRKSFANDKARISEDKWLAEDSGRISDLADENQLGIEFFKRQLRVSNDMEHIEGSSAMVQIEEYYSDHPSKSAAARIARVKCLIAIKEETP